MNMKLRNVPFSPPDMTEAEITEVANALRSGWITTGPRTKEFERLISMCCQTEKSVCLNSDQVTKSSRQPTLIQLQPV